jgi:Tfp pilus assembly ATPase PilU
MQTLEQCLVDLVRKGLVSMQDARQKANVKESIR